VNPLDWSVIGAPLLAGILVSASHVPLGREVLRRGIIFIDLAVAQIAGVGVILAQRFELGETPWAVQAAAAATALAGALLLHWTERRFGSAQEALIGSTFVLAATAGLLLLAGDPHGAEHMHDLLAGQLLWVHPAQLWPGAAVTALVLAAWFAGARHSRLGFYLLFALMVTASVQLVGVYLVFATLILPALATRRFPDARALPWGWTVAVAAYGLGLALSLAGDLPAGPLVVWCLALLAVVVGARPGRHAPS